MSADPSRQRPHSRSSRWLSGLSLALCFALALLAVPIGVFGLCERLGVSTPTVGLDDIPRVEAQLAEMHAAAAGRDRGVAFLGDSTVMSYPEGHSLPERLEKALADLRPHVRVYTIAAPGLDAFGYYLLSDAVVQARPDAAVVAFNMASLARSWRHAFARPELAAWLPAERLPEALTLPLHDEGLTADRLFAYVLLGRLGAIGDAHRLMREQARLGIARVRVGARLDAWLGYPSTWAFQQAAIGATHRAWELPGGKRPNADSLRRHLGPALAGADAGHPALRMLAATLARFEQAGVPTLVFAVPKNVENARRQGVDTSGLRRTAETVEAIARAHGAAFLDLHDALPDDLFRDPAGHMRSGSGDRDVPRRLADVLAPHVRAALGD